MRLRTTFDIRESDRKMLFTDKTLLIGSCFSSYMGEKFEAGNMPVLVNPYGTLFNPVSILNVLNNIIENKHYAEEDLYSYKGKWMSLDHYTSFESSDKDCLIEQINSVNNEAHRFLEKASFLFVTFGTANIYIFNPTGKTVSNCHKLPAKMFTRRLLKPADMIMPWKNMLDKLNTFNPHLNIIFTVSPVRHIADGLHINQVSKSSLFLLIEELLDYSPSSAYFPSYELMMDDLRDYRFYADDMVHPSNTAIRYVWEAFVKCYFDSSTLSIYQKIETVGKAMAHRINDPYSDDTKAFARKSLNDIASVEQLVPSINLEKEKKYFMELLER